MQRSMEGTKKYEMSTNQCRNLTYAFQVKGNLPTFSIIHYLYLHLFIIKAV